MPYDPVRKIFTPDFQANSQLPGWVPGMNGEDSGQDMGAIGSAFKQRLMTPPEEAPKGDMPIAGPEGKAGLMPKLGGNDAAGSAMKSLG